MIIFAISEKQLIAFTMLKHSLSVIAIIQKVTYFMASIIIKSIAHSEIAKYILCPIPQSQLRITENQEKFVVNHPFERFILRAFSL